MFDAEPLDPGFDFRPDSRRNDPDRFSAGSSRHVRLPGALDEALAEQAAVERRRPGAIMRDAFSDYLNRKAS